MANHDDPNEIRQHKSYQKATSRAEKYRENPGGLLEIVSDASQKAGGNMPQSFVEIRDSVLALFRLVAAFARGEYTEIPWKSIALVVGTLIYFLSPIDLIPDFLPFIGLADDVTLLAWTIKQLKTDIDHFRQWEADHKLS
jgi:uncharacterized membrane protein YkvA (DUF1232 family)